MVRAVAAGALCAGWVLAVEVKANGQVEPARIRVFAECQLWLGRKT